jgi:hypothetical protein
LYTYGNAIVGALFGTATTSGTSLSGTGSDFSFINRTVLSGSFSGTVTSKGSLTATTTGGVTFSGTYAPSYDTAASLATVAGQFPGFGITKLTGAIATTVTVTSSGALTAVNPICSGIGTMQPRPGGKAIFNVTVTFSGASCALTGLGTISGIAYFEPSNKQLVAMGLNGSKTDGFFWTGAK